MIVANHLSQVSCSITIFYCAVLCLVAQLCLTLYDPMDCSLPGSIVHGDSPGKNTRVSCHALLQGIFPTYLSNQGLLHCRRILYQLSYQGCPFIIVVFPLLLREFPENSWKTRLVGFSSFSFSAPCKIFDLPMKSE